MSKKVAELTQVVHMLFMKHHEKELELEALKDAYEYEIDLVIADAKGQLDELTRELEDREQRLKARPERERENEEDQVKIQALEKLLQAEKSETQSVRDRLIVSEKDVERLRSVNAQELARHSTEMDDKSKEIDLLRLHVADLERLARHSESQTSHVVDSLRKAVERLREETTTLREELGNSENLRETLTNRNKTLDDNVRRLKRELAKRSSLPDVDNARQHTDDGNVATFSQRKPNYDREIERLKQEIQRYRMELSNRETNYNRRFSDMQPIIVNRRPVSGRTSVVTNGHSLKNAELFNGEHGGLLQSGAYVGQERAVTGRDLREVSHKSYSDDLVNSSASVSPSMIRSTSSITSHERLPQLDAKLSIRRPMLTKPQPSKLLISKRSHRTTSLI